MEPVRCSFFVSGAGTLVNFFSGIGTPYLRAPSLNPLNFPPTINLLPFPTINLLLLSVGGSDIICCILFHLSNSKVSPLDHVLLTMQGLSLDSLVDGRHLMNGKHYV